MSEMEWSAVKISNDDFKSLIFERTGRKRQEVITGPQFGVDTSVVDLGNNEGLVLSSDPLSLIPSLGMKASAWLSVHLIVNDMATSGFAPQYAQFVLNLPTSLSMDLFNEYWKYIHEFCHDIGVSITGGHSSKIEGQHSTVCGGGTMILKAPLDQILVSSGAQPGSDIIMTKGSGLTATSILARSFPLHVVENCGVTVQEKAAENFYKTSSLKEALLASELLEPKRELFAMHDATEGGIVGAVYEMAMASGCGFNLDLDKILQREEVSEVGKLFAIDPRFCVGAGSMIMSVSSQCTNELINGLMEAGIHSCKIGEFTDRKGIFFVSENNQRKEFEPLDSDPYWGAFFQALKMGLQ